MLPITHRHQNHLLSGLPPAVRERVSPHLDWVPLALGQVLYEPESAVKFAYFPADCIASLQCATENGETAEVAAVGSEGMLDVGLFLDGDYSAHVAVIRRAGYAYRCSAQSLRLEFDECPVLQRVLLRYSQTLLTQITQTAVCNRYHSVSQQLCRWLLLNLDRTRSSHSTITQEAIARMLGVRREGVTEAAGRLRDQGVIDYHRGNVVVLDRVGLERAACSCYSGFSRALQRASRNCADNSGVARRLLPLAPTHSFA